MFEERGQVTLGKYLWDETLGKLDRYAALSDVDLRILTDDEHLASLPWPLLMRGEVFVTTDGWTISLGHAAGRPEAEPSCRRRRGC